MKGRQDQSVGDGSTAVQVNGDLYLNQYTQVRAIFEDLLQLNFPKIQAIAAETVRENMRTMFEELRRSMEKSKESLDPSRFEDPQVQYAMQMMAVDVARRGKKSNVELLCELLSLIVSKDCPDLIELIAGEAQRIAPTLSRRHLACLGYLVTYHEARFPVEAPTSPTRLDEIVGRVFSHISEAAETTESDLGYLGCVRCIDYSPVFADEAPPRFFEALEPEVPVADNSARVEWCRMKRLRNIVSYMELREPCRASFYTLTPIGRLIGWLHLGQLSSVDVKTLFR